ncbi:MAG: glycosyltransferase family 2 protein [Candidatus Marinimicrobia bacterium]|nr:glycosyltransferase family 2 protein [Candidatus Neomarinimicrobiota bacterium]
MSNTYIIVPVYNGEQYIESFLAQIDDKWRKKLIFVNDGSGDKSEEILNEKNVIVINHELNKGKGAAIKSASQWVKNHGGDSVITIDIDLQHPLELLSKFSHIPKETIVLGYRNDRKSMPVLRKFSNFMTSLLISVRTGTVIKDSQCGYRAFNMDIFNRVSCEENGFHYESEFLIKSSLIGWKINHINIPTIYENQPSAMNHFSDTMKFIKLWFKSFLWT